MPTAVNVKRFRSGTGLVRRARGDGPFWYIKAMEPARFVCLSG